MKSFNVLITGAGTTNAVTVLKGIQAMNDPSVRVLMGDMDPDRAGSYLGDEFVCMPGADDPDFERLVVEICRQRSVHLVIPIIDYEFPAWSRLAEKLLATGTRVVISKSQVISICQQKDLTIGYFHNMGVPCPMTWRIGEINDPSKLPFPVFLKPRCGRGSLDANRADDVETYKYLVARGADLIVQPCLKGDEVTIDTLSDLNGRFLAACPRMRLEIKSGQAVRSVTMDAPDLVNHAKKIVEGLPIVGPSNIQCFLTDHGPQFFEINARFGAATALSIHAGLNGPATLIALARGEPLPELKPRPSVWMLRYWQEVFLERKGWPIFFDLDGPILDVSRRHYEVYCDILREAGKPPTPFERYWQAKRARRPLEAIVSDTTGADFYSRYFEPEWFARIETDRYLALDRMWPWAVDVLADLYRDHELYLVTVRSDPEQLEKQLKRMSLGRWFRTVLCRPARQNAAQEKAKAIREHFSSLPRQAIIVGDTEADIDCGKEFGFVTVGVLSGIRDKDRLQATNCDYIRENILEALPLIRDLSGGIQ